MVKQYELTRQDYLNYNLIHLDHSKTAKKTINLQRFLVPILYIVLAFLMAWIGDIPLLYWLIVFSVAAIGWIMFFPQYTKRVVSKRISKMLDEGENKGLLGKQELSLMDDGILVSNEYKESKTKWNSIDNILVTDDYILVYVSAISAHIIPTRIFNNQADMNQFISLLNEKIVIKAS